MVIFIDHGQSAHSPLHSGDAVGSLKNVDLLSSNYAGNQDNGLSLPQSANITKTTTTTTTAPMTTANGSVEAGVKENTRISCPLPHDDADSNVHDNFCAALSCYPVVKEIARSVDLNTLHALSRTCCQFRVNLMQFRNQLVRATLRCRNELLDDNSRANTEASLPEQPSGPQFILDSSSSSPAIGKVSRCARDMVRECQRCAKVVCRNCTMKPPTTTLLKNRLRRLCHTCLEAPLSHHLHSHIPASDKFESAGLRPHAAPSGGTWEVDTPCSCETNIWLCKPCGQTLRSEDTSYKRVWSWRSRYSAYLGNGLATGIVESQGVKCGRQDTCLAAEDIEVEIDCEVDDWASEHSDHSSSSHHHHHHHHNPHFQPHGDYGHHGEWRDDEEPGYLRQEIEGIGGVVKQKVKKRVMVGASVEEADGEQQTGNYLKQEASGDVRSWCAWCMRVRPSNVEAAEM